MGGNGHALLKMGDERPSYYFCSTQFRRAWECCAIFWKRKGFAHFLYRWNWGEDAFRCLIWNSNMNQKYRTYAWESGPAANIKLNQDCTSTRYTCHSQTGGRLLILGVFLFSFFLYGVLYYHWYTWFIQNLYWKCVKITANFSVINQFQRHLYLSNGDQNVKVESALLQVTSYVAFFCMLRNWMGTRTYSSLSLPI